MHTLGACVSKKGLIPVLALDVRWKEQYGASLWSLIPTGMGKKKVNGNFSCLAIGPGICRSLSVLWTQQVGLSPLQKQKLFLDQIRSPLW